MPRTAPFSIVSTPEIQYKDLKRTIQTISIIFLILYTQSIKAPCQINVSYFGRLDAMQTGIIFSDAFLYIPNVIKYNLHADLQACYLSNNNLKHKI